MSNHLELIEQIATTVTAEHAAAVDGGEFPTATLNALKEAGLLGLISSTEMGGMGQGPRAAAEVVERLARECASSAMVTCMHYAGTAVIEAHGNEETRRTVAKGDLLTTLAFSEAGSRSHFWAPLSTATRTPEGVKLDAKKSWVTSASSTRKPATPAITAATRSSAFARSSHPLPLTSHLPPHGLEP